VLARDGVIGNHHVVVLGEAAERSRAVVSEAHPVPQPQRSMVGPRLEQQGRRPDHHRLRLLRVARLADRAVRVDRRRALGLDPALQAVEVHVLDRAGAHARRDQRVARPSRLVANINIA